MNDLKDLPRNSAVRKINELVKRVRLCKVHAYIIGHLKEQMPMMMGHAKKQQKLLDEMPTVFRSIMKKYNLAPGDFPEINDFKAKLAEHDFSKFNPIKPRLIEEAENVLSTEFPRLMEALPRSIDSFAPPKPVVGGGASATPFGEEADASNPFGDEADDAAAAAGNEWALADYVDYFMPQFNSAQSGGFVTGGAAKNILGGSGLPVAQLRKLWELADIDKDGQLDQGEFVVAMYLIEHLKQGNPMPERLEPSWIPPGKQ